MTKISASLLSTNALVGTTCQMHVVTRPCSAPLKTGVISLMPLKIVATGYTSLYDETFVASQHIRAEWLAYVHMHGFLSCSRSTL